MHFEVCTYVHVYHAIPSQWDLSTYSGPCQRSQMLSVAAEQFPFLGTHFWCVLCTADSGLERTSRETLELCVLASWSFQMSPELMTFANSVPDCQLHRGKEMTRLVRTTVSWGSGVPSTALCVWHPTVNTQPAMALRHSNLKVLFGQKKDSSAHVMASTRHVSSSLAGDNLGQMLSFTQRTPCSREGARNTPGEAVPWEHSRS